MRVLVTGANGLLGSNLVRELLRDGRQVRAMVRKGSDTRGLDGLGIERVVGDVRDPASVRAAVDGCEVVYNLAAVFSYYGFDLDEMTATAKTGAANVVDAAKDAGVRRLVLTSTCAHLGAAPDGSPGVDESAQPDMSAYPDYFKTKRLQEEVTFARGRERGLEVVAANPSLILGPFDFKPSVSMSTITGYILPPLQLTYAGGVNLVHAADVGRGHIIVGEKGTPFARHILSGENVTWRRLHELTSELVGLPPPHLETPRRVAWLAAAGMELGAKLFGGTPPATRELTNQLGSYFWVDNAKVRRLGFTPRPARDTLADTIAWLLDSDQLSARQKRRLRPAPDVEAARQRLRRAAA